MLYFVINNNDKQLHFLDNVILHMYNTYIWNMHKQDLKKGNVIFDHVVINHNYFRKSCIKLVN